MIALMFGSFGLVPPEAKGARHALLWAAALVFVVLSVAIILVVNFFSLFFGVTMNFLGRNGVKFRFLHLFRRIPVIGFTLPYMFGYAIWHNAATSGSMTIAYPSILTVIFGVLLLGGIVLVNTLLARQASRG